MGKKKSGSRLKVGEAGEPSSPAVGSQGADSEAPTPRPLAGEASAGTTSTCMAGAGEEGTTPGKGGAAAEELRAQLLEARQQIEELRVQLVAKDAEIARLSAAPQPAAVAAAPAAQPRAQDYLQLQQRLAALKQEQAEADAVRDAAWRQLKTAVADITKLAQADAPQPASGTPTGPGPTAVLA